MTKPFDMEIFLEGTLTGSHATRQRHLRQAKNMQAAISRRWQRDNPWRWQPKHINWFLKLYSEKHSRASTYYYQLTANLIKDRLKKSEKWER